MAALTLTAEQAVAMAQAAAIVATGKADGLESAWEDPDEVRRMHAAMAPYVELIRELQEELEVTSVDALREVAERIKSNATESIEYEQRCLRKLRAGNLGYCIAGGTPSETEEQTAAQVDERLGELAVAAAVLERLDGAVA